MLVFILFLSIPLRFFSKVREIHTNLLSDFVKELCASEQIPQWASDKRKQKPHFAFCILLRNVNQAPDGCSVDFVDCTI